MTVQCTFHIEKHLRGKNSTIIIIASTLSLKEKLEKQEQLYMQLVKRIESIEKDN